ncbi:MAG: hypothetical protein ABSD32_07300 [Mycobacterium sp.]
MFTGQILTFCEHTMRVVCAELDVELVEFNGEAQAHRCRSSSSTATTKHVHCDRRATPGDERDGAYPGLEVRGLRPKIPLIGGDVQCREALCKCSLSAAVPEPLSRSLRHRRCFAS